MMLCTRICASPLHWEEFHLTCTIKNRLEVNLIKKIENVPCIIPLQLCSVKVLELTAPWLKWEGVGNGVFSKSAPWFWNSLFPISWLNTVWLVLTSCHTARLRLFLSRVDKMLFSECSGVGSYWFLGCSIFFRFGVELTGQRSTCLEVYP